MFSSRNFNAKDIFKNVDHDIEAMLRSFRDQCESIMGRIPDRNYFTPRLKCLLQSSAKDLLDEFQHQYRTRVDNLTDELGETMERYIAVVIQSKMTEDSQVKNSSSDVNKPSVSNDEAIAETSQAKMKKDSPVKKPSSDVDKPGVSNDKPKGSRKSKRLNASASQGLASAVIDANKEAPKDQEMPNVQRCLRGKSKRQSASISQGFASAEMGEKNEATQKDLKKKVTPVQIASPSKRLKLSKADESNEATQEDLKKKVTLVQVASPAKRLKLSKTDGSKKDSQTSPQKKMTSVQGNVFSQWTTFDVALKDAPHCAGIYEVKVRRGKHTAYVGTSGNIQETLMSHDSGKTKGLSLIDNFICRNRERLEIRFQATASLALAEKLSEDYLNKYILENEVKPAFNKL